MTLAKESKAIDIELLKIKKKKGGLEKKIKCFIQEMFCNFPKMQKVSFSMNILTSVFPGPDRNQERQTYSSSSVSYWLHISTILAIGLLQESAEA